MLVFPSLFEGFGIPLVEAMAAGCPIATSNLTSLPEVAGNAAVTFNPIEPAEIASAIEALWCDDGLRTRLVAAGRRRLETFSAARAVEAHRMAFSQAIEAFSPRRYWTNLFCYQPRQLLRVGLKRWSGAYARRISAARSRRAGLG
jgi:hypothetical protein